MRIETKQQEKVVGIIMGSIFMFAGVIVLAIMLLSVAKEKAFNNENGQTMAYVEKIERAADYRDIIYVTYEVDGKEYSNVKLGYETGAAEGYQISIYYDKDNPEIIVNKNFTVQNVTVGICIAVVLIIAGIVALIIAFRKKVEKKAKPEVEPSYKKQLIQLKLAVFFTAIVFATPGIIMVASATRQSPTARDFQKNAVPVIAYVDDVIEERRVVNNSSNTTYYYTVSYEYEGTKFSNISFITKRKYFTEGEYATIYCHKEKPHIVEPVLNTGENNKTQKTMGWVLIGVGGFIAFIGVVAKPGVAKDN